MGLFENPYLDVEKSKTVVGNPEFMVAGYEAQLKSIVMLKNRGGVLPLGKDVRVYVPKRYQPASAGMFGFGAAEETGKTAKSDFKTSFGLPGGASTFHASIEKTSDGREVVDTQASYAVPLALGVFDDENIPRAARHLTETCRRENVDDGSVARPEYSLMTGFIGTAWISKALSDGGYSDIAYRLLQQESYPSWLYPVNQGATTIWERLNSYTVEDGFGGNNSMNSFNHYSFGAVGQWMVADSLGIQRDENSPGFKHFILKPEVDTTGEMTFAEGFYQSMYGRMESAWKVEEGTLIYRATVPANTTATLYLQASGTDVTENGTPAAEADGVTFLGREGGMAQFELDSGAYEFHTGYGL